MEIEVGKYIILSDPQCMWIEEKSEGKHKQGEATERQKRITGYFRNFTDLLEDFSRRKILSSEAEEVSEVLKEFASIQKDIEAFIKSAAKKKKGAKK